MSFKSLHKFVAAAVVAAASIMAGVVSGQSVVVTPPSRPMSVAAGSNLYCGGYIQTARVDTAFRLVGAENESDAFIFKQNDTMYINFGANKGVQEGQMLSVIRPKGRVHSHWSHKDDLGIYVQEVGAVQVLKVRPTSSVVKVISSCDNLLLGDLLVPTQARVSPVYEQRPKLDLFAEPSGKAMGRLFMSRGNQELLSRDQVVYIDLGAEDNVGIGDHLTVFRPLSDGNLLLGPNESVEARSYGFESKKYRGGRFSNQSARKRGAEARGSVATTRYSRSERPDIRKVVGELVILNVRERVATAVITRTAQEIHTGDWVEVQ